MLEALRIHSVLFDILSSMGISEIKSLELLLCAVLIVMGWSYLYVFYFIGKTAAGALLN